MRCPAHTAALATPSERTGAVAKFCERGFFIVGFPEALNHHYSALDSGDQKLDFKSVITVRTSFGSAVGRSIFGYRVDTHSWQVWHRFTLVVVKQTVWCFESEDEVSC